MAPSRTIAARVASLALVAMTAAAPAEAVHAASCADTWSKSNACSFALRALPVTVTATATAAGTASVRAWIAFVGPTGDHVLTECKASGQSRASCTGTLDAGAPIDPFAQTVPLVCRVEGSGGGVFGCSSEPRTPDDVLAHACDGLITQPVGEDPTGGGQYPASVQTGRCVGFPSAPSGWMTAGDWQIRITRGFTRTTFTDESGPRCARSMLRPGDMVEVTVTTGAVYIFRDADVPACPPGL